MGVFFHFAGSDAVDVHAVPHIGYVGDHEGGDDGYPAHYLEGEERRRAVADGERGGGVEQRGIVGGVVVSGHKEEREYHEHGTDAREPHAVAGLGKRSGEYGVEHGHGPDEEQRERPPHLQIVVEIFVVNPLGRMESGGLLAAGGEQKDGEEHEEHGEHQAVHQHTAPVAAREVGIVADVEHEV